MLANSKQVFSRLRTVASDELKIDRNLVLLHANISRDLELTPEAIIQITNAVCIQMGVPSYVLTGRRWISDGSIADLCDEIVRLVNSWRANEAKSNNRVHLGSTSLNTSESALSFGVRSARMNDQSRTARREEELKVSSTLDSSSKEPVVTDVRLGCSAPCSAIPGEEFTARVVAYHPDVEMEINRRLEELSPGSRRALDLKNSRWAKGAPVRVTLSAQNLLVEPEYFEFDWNGIKEIVDFDVFVPAGAPPRCTALKFDISVGGMPLIRMRMDLDISTDRIAKKQEVTVDSPRSAFASYSSSDRARVLDMVFAMERIAGIDVFIDRNSLRSGEQWESILEREIRERDLFILFWSKSARNSYWVTREWKQAWKDRRPPQFQLYAIDPKEDVAPPKELIELNFEDPLMLLRAWLVSQKS